MDQEQYYSSQLHRRLARPQTSPTNLVANYVSNWFANDVVAYYIAHWLPDDIVADYITHWLTNYLGTDFIAGWFAIDVVAYRLTNRLSNAQVGSGQF